MIEFSFNVPVGEHAQEWLEHCNKVINEHLEDDSFGFLVFLQMCLDEDSKLELNKSPADYRLAHLRAAMYWKIKELEREMQKEKLE